VAGGRVAPAEQPWLADHAVNGTCVLAGTALLDLALRAAHSAGTGTALGELVIEAPLALSRQGTAELQIVADPAQRTIEVFSRPEQPGGPWRRHAQGTLQDAEVPPPARAFPTPLPPSDAEEIPVDYASLAGRGYEFGPAFKALHGLWRRGEELFAELRLPDEAPVGFAGPGLHPVLADAALHALALTEKRPEDHVGLPFVWHDVWAGDRHTPHAHAHLAPSGQDEYTVTLAGTDGEPFFRGTLGIRTVALRELTGAVPTDSAYRTRWTELPAPPPAPAPKWALRGTDHLGVSVDRVELADADAALYVPPPDDVRAAVLDTLSHLRRWLEADRPADVPLVVLTRGDDLAHAAARGLVRSAQSEHPGRFLLVETDTDPRSPARLADTVTAGRPHLRISEGRLQAPELARVSPGHGARPDLTGGTVLITGGTGTLGSLLARHLVTEYGVRGLLLTSRRGARDAGPLLTELTGLGAEVDVVACDVADRDSLAAALDRVPAGRPLVGVVHAAGALADGVVTGLTAEQVERVLRPKVDGALNLHELTKGTDLAAFVLFSSLAGVLGSAGQGNYAAANAFLDAFAEHRRAAGLPAQSQAWSMWEEISGMTEVLRETVQSGGSPDGTLPMPTDFALALFDEALRQDDAALTLARFDIAKLRTRGAPPLLRGLVPAGPAPAACVVPLRDLPPAERAARLLAEVRAAAADLLGHQDAEAVPPDRSLAESGLDSLTSVALRNRLSALTGLRLPATFVFDHPVPRSLADHLLRMASA